MPGPDDCEICGAEWISGDVCGSCGWVRPAAPAEAGSPSAGDPEAPLELDLPAPPGGPAPASPRAVAPRRPVAVPQRRGMSADARLRWLRLAPLAFVLLVGVLVAGGVRILYPRWAVVVRAADLRQEAQAILAVEDQPLVNARVLAIRTAAWAAAKELEVVPGSLKIRLAPRSAPTTRGEAAMAMLGDKSIRSERWVTARLSFSVLLRKWGHERETPLELEGTLALTTDQRVEYCEEETVELASGRKGRAARPAPPDPAPPVQLGAEGSLTGLGLSVASFSGELRALNGRAAEVLGLPTLGAPLDDAAWKRARKSEKAAAELKAEATRLRDQAGSLQEAVEVRFGLRLGKPWTGLQRALALLESALDHWREGRRRPCAEALERYEQWSHVVLLKVEEQLTAKGVYLGDTRTARPQPAPKEPAKP